MYNVDDIVLLAQPATALQDAIDIDNAY